MKVRVIIKFVYKVNIIKNPVEKSIEVDDYFNPYNPFNSSDKKLVINNEVLNDIIRKFKNIEFKDENYKVINITYNSSPGGIEILLRYDKIPPKIIDYSVQANKLEVLTAILYTKLDDRECMNNESDRIKMCINKAKKIILEVDKDLNPSDY